MKLLLVSVYFFVLIYCQKMKLMLNVSRSETACPRCTRERARKRARKVAIISTGHESAATKGIFSKNQFQIEIDIILF
jgi:hypothetical protein